MSMPDRVIVLDYKRDGHSKDCPYQVKITKHDNGSMNLSDMSGEGFIYLYPSQVKKMIAFLKGKKVGK